MILVAMLSGCGAFKTQVYPSPLMDHHEVGGDIPEPPADRALVVFLRPTTAGPGRALSAVLYDGEQFLGAIMPFERVLHETKPGVHRFMVLSESVDFLDAELDAGKAYFARVVPRPGWGRTRFSLAPITPGNKNWPHLEEWLTASRRVTPNLAGEAWARSHDASVVSKRKAGLAVWLQKADRPTLRPGDGLADP